MPFLLFKGDEILSTHLNENFEKLLPYSSFSWSRGSQNQNYGSFILSDILWFDRISAPSFTFIYRISDWENCFSSRFNFSFAFFHCLAWGTPSDSVQLFRFQEEEETQKRYFRHFYWNISNYFSLNRAFKFHYSFTTEKLAQG